MDVSRFQLVKDQEIMTDKSLAQKYIEYCDAGMPNGEDWDAFFDHVKIAPELRTDFAVATILKQAQEIIKQETK